MQTNSSAKQATIHAYPAEVIHFIADLNWLLNINT